MIEYRDTEGTQEEYRDTGGIRGIQKWRIGYRNVGGIQGCRRDKGIGAH